VDPDLFLLKLHGTWETAIEDNKPPWLAGECFREFDRVYKKDLRFFESTFEDNTMDICRCYLQFIKCLSIQIY
jgi:hypothetical protein